MTAAAVVVEALTKRYGDRTVVDDVSLSVAPGEIVAVLGPNGAGKTTTVEIIEGYRRGDAGTVRVLGEDPMRGGRSLRARVGLMLQAGGIDLRARPRESIEQHARFHADPRDPAELVELLGLRPVATTPFRRLSGGERQRLGLALALVGRPEVLILDEPTAGMDPEARAVVRAVIAEQRAAGVAILLTSHDLADVERLADRIVVLVAGRVAADGTPAELAAGLRPRLRFRLDQALAPEDVAVLSASAGAPVVPTGDGAWLEVRDVAPSPALIGAVVDACLARGWLMVESRTVGGSLEDAYLDLVATAGSGGAESAA
ncbi:MAG TPA: ABC transporter ATP-binding protein [Methylomirabilota bacterium]|nr:ABC transporter ATP-binding protein [Methylomirabilota bacterium]